MRVSYYITYHSNKWTRSFCFYNSINTTTIIIIITIRLL